jgi:hypothetical protein
MVETLPVVSQEKDLLAQPDYREVPEEVWVWRFDNGTLSWTEDERFVACYPSREALTALHGFENLCSDPGRPRKVSLRWIEDEVRFLSCDYELEGFILYDASGKEVRRWLI